MHRGKNTMKISLILFERFIIIHTGTYSGTEKRWEIKTCINKCRAFVLIECLDIFSFNGVKEWNFLFKVGWCQREIPGNIRRVWECQKKGQESQTSLRKSPQREIRQIHALLWACFDTDWWNLQGLLFYKKKKKNKSHVILYLKKNKKQISYYWGTTNINNVSPSWKIANISWTLKYLNIEFNFRHLLEIRVPRHF